MVNSEERALSHVQTFENTKLSQENSDLGHLRLFPVLSIYVRVVISISHNNNIAIRFCLVSFFKEIERTRHHKRTSTAIQKTKYNLV